MLYLIICFFMIYSFIICKNKNKWGKNYAVLYFSFTYLNMYLTTLIYIYNYGCKPSIFLRGLRHDYD